MINIYGFSAIGTFLASSFRLSGYETALFSNSIRATEGLYHINCNSTLLGDHLLSIPEINYNYRSISLNIICSTCSGIDCYLEHIQYMVPGIRIIMLLQNGIIPISFNINACNTNEKINLIRATIGYTSCILESNKLVHINRNLPLLSMSVNSFSLLSDAGFAKALQNNFRTDLLPNDEFVIWKKLVKSGPHFLFGLLDYYPSIGFQDVNSRSMLLIWFEEYFNISKLICPEIIDNKEIFKATLESLEQNKIINSATQRFIKNYDTREFISLVSEPYKIGVSLGLKSPSIKHAIDTFNQLTL
ncbi:hypothetical protein OAE36_00015 [bacterium]|nr:hypothetical protein [bacterium]